MDSPCSDKWELQYIGSAIKKQGGGLPGLRIVNSTIGRHKERKTNATRHPDRHRPALHFASRLRPGELTAEQRSACMGDYEKYCEGVTPGGGRIIARLAKEGDKITPACKALAAAEKK